MSGFKVATFVMRETLPVILKINTKIMNMKNKEKLRYILKLIGISTILVMILSQSSCYVAGVSDDDITFSSFGENNIYTGTVVDGDGSPIADRTVIITSSQLDIAEIITDSNGFYQVNGDIYDRHITFSLVNDEDDFYVDSEYTLSYTYDPFDQTINVPPLISIPSSSVQIEIFNNTDLDISINCNYVIGLCQKYFEDDVEISSLCYENDNKLRNIPSNRAGAILNLRVETGTSVSTTVSNLENSITETFIVVETNEEKTINFN